MRTSSAGRVDADRIRGGAGTQAGKGFTLVELLVVLTLVSIVATLVVIRVGGGAGTVELRTAAEKTAATLRYACSQAGWEGAVYGVTFDMDGNKFDLFTAKAPPQGADALDEAIFGGRNSSRSVLKTYPFSRGVRLEKAVLDGREEDTGTFDVVFYPTGGSSGGELVLGNEQKMRYRIVVDYITGGVSLWQEKD